MLCRLLGNLYVAEALVMLDHTSEALQYLSPDHVINNDEQTGKTG